MVRCQICGRHPAKEMAFTAHQGFVIFRRAIELSGVFCRDHAIEAYLAARGATLKGMWFSPGSLLFGTLRSLYDSVKLLDLPGEVRDEPWVVHIVACPHCQHKGVAPAGPAECDQCHQSFAVVSCGSCNVVHVVRTASGLESLDVVCRCCGRRTRGPDSVRNWSSLLFARAIAEICASIASADCHVAETERDTFREAVKKLFQFWDPTVQYLEEYFEHCVRNHSLAILRTFSTDCDEEFLGLFLGVAVAVAEADGQINDKETEQLRRVASCLGINPDTVFDGTWSQHRETFNSQAWWIALGVSQDAPLDEVLFAYRRLAMQFHPDIWAQGSSGEKTAAEKRMRAVNAAFEQAKQAIAARDRGKAAPRPATTHGPAQSKRPQSRGSEYPTPRPSAPKTSTGIDVFPVVGLAVFGVIVMALFVVVVMRPHGGLPANRDNSQLERHASAVTSKERAPGVPAEDPITSPRKESVEPVEAEEVPVKNPTTSLTKKAARATEAKVGQRRRRWGTVDAPITTPTKEAARATSETTAKLWETSIAEDRRKARLYFDTALGYAKSGDFDAALHYFTRAIELNPNDALAYHYRGLVHEDKRDWAKALADFEKAKELGYRPE